MVIDDAASFYQLIKANPHYSGVADEEVVKALDQNFGGVYRAANEDLRSGIGRDKYFYFQGMVGGMYVAWKSWLTHLQSSAMEQSIDLSTGQRIKPREN